MPYGAQPLRCWEAGGKGDMRCRMRSLVASRCTRGMRVLCIDTWDRSLSFGIGCAIDTCRCRQGRMPLGGCPGVDATPTVSPRRSVRRVVRAGGVFASMPYGADPEKRVGKREGRATCDADIRTCDLSWLRAAHEACGCCVMIRGTGFFHLVSAAPSIRAAVARVGCPLVPRWMPHPPVHRIASTLG